MHVEITKMVYQHPWYVSSAPHPSNGRLGVIFISPTEKVAVGVELPQFCYWPDAESSWPDASGRPDRWAGKTLIGRWPASGRLPPDASGRRYAALETLCTRSGAAFLRPIGCRQRPVQRSVACLPSHSPSVRSQRPVAYPASGPASGHHSELISSRSCIRLGSNLHAWTWLDLLGLLLCFKGLTWGVDHQIITLPSSKLRLAPYWTTKQTLVNSLVQFGCIGHQTPKSKVNGPRVHFPYNLPIFGDWCQHDQSKQIIRIWKLKTTYLLGCSAKGKVIWY
jgi:hypothetical protein